jgi:transposase
MERRYALRDDQWERLQQYGSGYSSMGAVTAVWERLQPLGLPGDKGHVGATAKDNRLFIDAVLYRFRAGIPWRDLPERFGYWHRIYVRFNRWSKQGVWQRIIEQLAKDANNEYAMIDATVVRAHRSAAGARKKGAVQRNRRSDRASVAAREA